MSFGRKAFNFFDNLESPSGLPGGYEVMNPFHDPEVLAINRAFYDKYYNDDIQRVFMFGINPGRFGAGITGICFADPIRLESVCRISNPFPKKPELSSLFIFDVIQSYGNPEKFYGDFYITAMSPLGFLKNGLNINNYYDDRALQKAVETFILDSIAKQMEFGCITDVAICIGEGANYKYFNAINDKHRFFQEIIPVAHPRFILQYKRKQLDSYRARYLEVMKYCKQFLK
jgi:hypothetical protein